MLNLVFTSFLLLTVGLQTTVAQTLDICSTVVTGSFDSIATPNYPADYGNGVTCTRTINVPDGKVLRVQFQSFDVEFHPSCAYDSLLIASKGVPFPNTGRFYNEDGNLQVGFVKYCGNSPPQSFEAYDDITFQFISDNTTAYSGFKISLSIATAPTTMEFKDICDGSALSGDRGFLFSPNFPGSYTSGLTCTKTISVPAGKRVDVDILDIYLQLSTHCLSDSLIINIGGETLGGAPLCGFVPGADFSTTEDVTFTFRSDATSEAPGFRVFWSISTGNDSSRSVVVFLATHNLVNSYRQLNCGTYTFLSIFNPRIFSLTSHYVKRSPGSYITSVVIFPPQKPVRFNKMYCMDFFS